MSYPDPIGIKDLIKEALDRQRAEFVKDLRDLIKLANNKMNSEIDYNKYIRKADGLIKKWQGKLKEEQK